LSYSTPISGYQPCFFGGKPEQAILKAYEEDEIAICQQIAEEIEEVATRKFAQQAEQIKGRLERLMVNALWVTVRGELNHIPLTERHLANRWKSFVAGSLPYVTLHL
jgi:hypothetical protein